MKNKYFPPKFKSEKYVELLQHTSLGDTIQPNTVSITEYLSLYFPWELLKSMPLTGNLFLRAGKHGEFL